MLIRTLTVCALIGLVNTAAAEHPSTAPMVYHSADPAWYFPQGMCTYFAAREFDVVAPRHLDWGNHAGTWVQNARQQGWKTSRNPWDAKPGALIVWTGGTFGHVAVVRQVTGERVVIEEMNGGRYFVDEQAGKTDEYNVVRKRVLNVSSNFRRGQLRFAGFIYPETIPQLAAR